MTLNVSLRVPDGIVIASDSLATQMRPISQKINVNGLCDGCGRVVEIHDVETPTVVVPSSSWPYAQKLFSLRNKFGIATFNAGFINNRSIYNHFIELNPKLPEPTTDNAFESYAQAVGDYFHEQLKIELAKTGVNIDLQPPDWSHVGFQLVGFAHQNSELVARTIFIQIGKTVTMQTQEGIGCSVTGDLRTVNLLWQGKGMSGANFNAFSLQDAIDYAKFLIRTTADFQRFSGEMPTVGGEIDIALVTNNRGFQWIAQKSLYKLLDKRTEEQT